MTSAARVVVVAVMVGFAMGGSGCLTTALVGLCVSGCGAGCVGALGTCPLGGDGDGDTPAPRPVEIGPPTAAASSSEGADEG